MKKFITLIFFFIYIYGNLMAQNPAGNALQFDGVDDYVNVTQNASLDITDNVSLEALIKPISIDTFERIIFKGSGDISAADFA